MTPDPIPPLLLRRLIERASAWTGFRLDAILHRAVTDLAAQRLRGCTPAQLEQAIDDSDPALVHDICQAVSVGETYFFRNPEQLQYLMREVVPRYADQACLRVWSAGCASGEEAWSLSAILSAETTGTRQRREVLGTDLVARNIDLARLGRYGRWSFRHAQQLAPTFRLMPDGWFEVEPALRDLVSFATYNLLDSPAESFGKFQIIFCRNVLVYFSPESVKSAIGHLLEALTPDGVLVFGSMDVGDLPDGLERVGSAELQLYARATAKPSRKSVEMPARSAPSRPPQPSRAPARLPVVTAPILTTAPVAPPLPEGPTLRAALAAPVPPEPVAVHLRALTLIEGADLDGADRLLADLQRRVPDYLPALLERALLHLRLGERVAGQRLMRDLLGLCRARPPDEVITAPEPMTIAFVRASAEASLKGAA